MSPAKLALESGMMAGGSEDTGSEARSEERQSRPARGSAGAQAPFLGRCGHPGSVWRGVPAEAAVGQA